MSEAKSLLVIGAGIAGISAALEAAEGRGVPNWLELDGAAFQGSVRALPTKEDIEVLVNEQIVVELYSR